MDAYSSKKIEPDVYINIRFKTTVEGGRTTPIGRKLNGPGFYACPLIIDGKYFDCRIFNQGKELALGKYHELPLVFLDSSLAAPHIQVGKKVALWEGKEIAYGKITKICKPLTRYPKMKS